MAFLFSSGSCPRPSAMATGAIPPELLKHGEPSFTTSLNPSPPHHYRARHLPRRLRPPHGLPLPQPLPPFPHPLLDDFRGWPGFRRHFPRVVPHPHLLLPSSSIVLAPPFAAASKVSKKTKPLVLSLSEFAIAWQFPHLVPGLFSHPAPLAIATCPTPPPAAGSPSPLPLAVSPPVMRPRSDLRTELLMPSDASPLATTRLIIHPRIRLLQPHRPQASRPRLPRRQARQNRPALPPP